MHGFLGCVNQGRREAEPMLRWLSAWIGLEPVKKSVDLRRPGFRFVGTVHGEGRDRPFAAREDGPLVGFRGFIARDQLSLPDGARPETEAETAEALLELYLEEGPAALAGLNGRYLAWVRDADGSVVLANDLLGLKPSFLWHQGAGFVFSSHIWAIASYPGFSGRIRLGGVVDLLLYNHHQGERTLFESVSLLPPGSVLTLRDGKTDIQRICRPTHSEENWDLGIEQAADRMYELLEASVDRRVHVDREMQLPLSGGLDTRAMLGFLRERGCQPEALTQYQHGLYGLDRRYSRRIARIAGIRHRTTRIPDDFLSRYRMLSVAAGGGLYDIHPARYLSLVESMRHDLPVVSGYMGGELSGQLHTSDVDFSTPEEQFQLVFQEANRCRLPPERTRAVLGTDRGGLVDESIAGYRDFFLSQAGDYSHRYNNWNLLVFQRRYTSFQLHYIEQFVPVRAPFCDRPYVDFMCSLPFAALEGQRAYRHMQATRFPDLARVPDTNTGLPPRITTKYMVCDLLHTQYQRFLRRPLQHLLRLRRWVRSQMEQYGFALQGASSEVLEHILANEDRLSAYLDIDNVRAEVSRQSEGDNSAVMGLLGLSAFATALELAEDPMGGIEGLRGAL